MLQVLQVIKPMVKTQTFCDEALSTTDTSEVPTSANRNDGETTANFFVRQKANLCLWVKWHTWSLNTLQTQTQQLYLFTTCRRRLKNSASRLTKYKHVQLRDTSGNSFDLYGKPTGEKDDLHGVASILIIYVTSKLANANLFENALWRPMLALHAQRLK